MRVIFQKSDDGRRCTWRAELPGNRRLEGSIMAARSAGTDLPHDLAELVVEADLGLEHGFWNLVANGATFRSLGRRPTRPGRQLIATYRAELNDVEGTVNAQVQAWRDGRPTPVGPALKAMRTRWRALRPGEELIVEWPTRRLSRPRHVPGPCRRGGGEVLGEMRIRSGSDADLDALVEVFRSERAFFGDCLAKQQAGGGVLLVAWLDGWPVGDVFLDRDPAEEPQLRRWLPGVPRFNHLEVLAPLQRRGIGTALLRAGEATARKLGHRRIALGVGLDNPGARRLYERLGYTDWGHGSIVATYQDRDHDGPPVTITEVIDMLVKRL